MTNDEVGKVIKELPAVGAERALKVLAGRWKLIILWLLLEAPLRLRDLEASIPSVSQKVLLGQLRELIAHGLVERTETAGILPMQRPSSDGRHVR